MAEQPTSSRPNILWGQEAAVSQVEAQGMAQGAAQGVAPAAAPVNPLAAAAALLQEEREKHEKRCVTGQRLSCCAPALPALHSSVIGVSVSLEHSCRNRWSWHDCKKRVLQHTCRRLRRRTDPASAWAP